MTRRAVILSETENDMTLQEYFKANDAIMRGGNPPSNNPKYQTDPKSVWKYYMRNFGYGLADFDPQEGESLIKGLYYGWFMRLEFNNRNRPDVDAKEFFSWICSARDEAVAHKAQEQPQ
jgi:hypothetical protein